jgi:hypothetical protein
MQELGSLINAGQARVQQALRAVQEAQATYDARVTARDARQQELRLIRPLVEKGIEPRLSLMQAESAYAVAVSEAAAAAAAVSRARSAVAEAQSSLNQQRQDWRSIAANDLATAQAAAEAAQATAEALIDAQSLSQSDVATARANVENLQSTAQAVAATATVVFQRAGLNAIEQTKLEITVSIDAQGLLQDNPEADAAAIAAIQDAMEPYQNCRVGIVLTFGWNPNVGTGSAIAAEFNDLLDQAEPEIFVDAVTENFANIGAQGRADLTLYFFRGCQAIDPDN